MSEEPWFRMRPSKFMAGCRGLNANEVKVYISLICRIMEHGAPVDEDHEILSTYCEMRPSSFAKALERLLRLKKIIRTADGHLSNAFCDGEISWRASCSENQKRAGKKSAEKRKENQGQEAADVEPAFNHKRREEKKEEVAVVERAREPAPKPSLAAEGQDLGALLGRVMAAVGLNPNDIPSAHWMPHVAEQHLLGWLNAGIPPDAIERVATESRQRHRDPPNGPKALDHAMRAWLTARSAPVFTAPVIPLEIGPSDARRPSRQSRGDATLDAFLSGARG